MLVVVVDVVVVLLTQSLLSRCSLETEDSAWVGSLSLRRTLGRSDAQAADTHIPNTKNVANKKVHRALRFHLRSKNL